MNASLDLLPYSPALPSLLTRDASECQCDFASSDSLPVFSVLNSLFECDEHAFPPISCLLYPSTQAAEAAAILGC